MTDELDDDTLERFAIEVEHLPSIYADEEYQRLIEEEKNSGRNENDIESAKEAVKAAIGLLGKK